MLGDPKKLAMLIIGKGKDKKQDGPSGKELAQEMLDAIEAKDAQGLAEAVSALVMHCQDEPEDDYEDDDE